LALENLPSTLDATYERILQQINNCRDKHLRRAVIKVLQLVSLGPGEVNLMMPELREAISVSGGTTILDPDMLIDIERVIDACLGLVKRSWDGKFLHFAHFSICEYLHQPSLLSTDLSEFHRSDNCARELLVKAGLRFLNLRAFSADLEWSTHEIKRLEWRNNIRPFYRYISCQLYRLLGPKELGNGIIFDLTKQLFSVKKTANFVALSFNLGLYLERPLISGRLPSLRRSPPFSGNRHSPPPAAEKSLFLALLDESFTPLHLAASLGLVKLCEYFIQSGAPVDAQSRLGSPLDCAVAGCAVFCKLLQPAKLLRPEACIPIVDLLTSAGAKRPEQVETLYWRLDLADVILRMSWHHRRLDIFARLLELGMRIHDKSLAEFRQLCDTRFRSDGTVEPDEVEAATRILRVAAARKSESRLFADLFKLIWDFGTAHPSCNILANRDFVRPAIPALDDESFFETIMLAIACDDFRILQDNASDPRLQQFPEWHRRGCTLVHVATNHCAVKCMGVLIDLGMNPSASDAHGRQPVHLCTTDHHEAVLHFLLSHNVTTTAVDKDGCTLWHRAARFGSLRILKILVASHCDADKALKMTDAFGHTPLSLVISTPHVEVALFLLENCSERGCFKGPEPLLFTAARFSPMTVIQKLIDAGEKPSNEDPALPTPLNYVTFETPLDCLKLLKSHCPSFHTGLREGLTPVEGYIRTELGGEADHRTTVRELLDSADPAYQLSRGKILWEALCRAESLEHIRIGAQPGLIEATKEVVELLVERGVMTAYEDETGVCGLKPLAEVVLQITRSVWSGSSPIARGLGSWPFFSTLIKIVRKAKYFATIVDDAVVLFLLKLAVYTDSDDLACELLQKGVNVHHLERGRSALDQACIPGTGCSVSLFKKIIEHADKTKLDDFNPGVGVALIHRLGEFNVRDAVPKLELLVKAGADPNLRTSDRDGWPPLLYHLSHDISSRTAIKLLELGADPTLKGGQWDDAGLCAAVVGNVGFLQALRRNERATGCKFPWHSVCDFCPPNSTRQTKYCTAVHIAAANNRVECLKFYVDEGIFTDLDTRAGNGWTPLHMAVGNCRREAMVFLISRGATVNAKNDYGQLPLHLAVECHNLKAVRILLNSGSRQTPDAYGVRPMDLAKFSTSGSEIALVLKERHSASADGDFPLPKLKVEIGSGFLEQAIRRGQYDVCKELLSRGISVNTRMMSCNDCSPLLHALRLDELDIVGLLLQNGADTTTVYCPEHWNKIWVSPVTVLDVACVRRQATRFFPELLTDYIDRGGEFSNHNPLHTAAAAGNKEAIEIFLRHKAYLYVHYISALHQLLTYIPGNRKILLGVFSTSMMILFKNIMSAKCAATPLKFRKLRFTLLSATTGWR
jgi:ankyrin repeat protein